MSAEVVVAQGAEVCRRHIEHSVATSLAVLSLHAESGAGVGHKNARREFRVGIELQAVFDHVRVFQIHAGLAGTDHETTVSEAAVVLVEFFFADKVSYLLFLVISGWWLVVRIAIKMFFLHSCLLTTAY